MFFDQTNRPSFDKARKRLRPTRNVKWCKPVGNVVKINVDASVNNLGEASIGFIFRDHNGNCIKWKGEKLGKTSIILAETVALRNAILEAKRDLFTHVHIEGDNATVIEAVKGSRSCPWEIGQLIRDIQVCIHSFTT